MLNTRFFLALIILNSTNAFNAFIQPPREGLDIPINSDYIVKWQCDDCGFNLMNLSIFQDKHDGTWNEDQLLINAVNQNNYTWKAHTLGLPITNGFHFTFRWLDEAVDSGALFIRDGSISSSISASSSASPSASSSASRSTSRSSTSAMSTSSFTASNTFSSATSASATSPAPAAEVKSNNKALKMGLGVGIPSFFLIVGSIIGFVLFKRRSRQSKQEQIHEAPASEIRPHNLKAGHEIQELPNQPEPSELPDTQVRDGRTRP